MSDGLPILCIRVRHAHALSLTGMDETRADGIRAVPLTLSVPVRLGFPILAEAPCAPVNTQGEYNQRTGRLPGRFVRRRDRSVSESLRGIFQAERLAREKVREAEARTAEMEAEARAKAEGIVRAAEGSRGDLTREVEEEAKKAARARGEEMEAALSERRNSWRERFEKRAPAVVESVVRAVLGLGEGEGESGEPRG